MTKKDETKCNEILGRLKEISNTKSNTDLANALGLKQSSVSTAKTRGMVPTSWIINASSLFGVSADWLIYGDNKNRQNSANLLEPAKVEKNKASSVAPPKAQASELIE